jgi:hypothetical protein
MQAPGAKRDRPPARCFAPGELCLQRWMFPATVCNLPASDRAGGAEAMLPSSLLGILAPLEVAEASGIR